MTPNPPTPPPPRLGPRPLALHLTMAQIAWSSCLLDWTQSSSDSPGSNPASPAAPPPPAAATAPPAANAELAKDLASAKAALAAHEPEAVQAALLRQVCGRFDRFLTGLELYRTHPYRRALADPPILWREAESRLLDFAPAGGRPVLFVPSLVNRAYVLDLSEQRSLMRGLAGRGLRPLLLDWGAPGPVSRHFTLTDYIAGRLDRALTAARTLAGGPLPVVGYCMGGLLAVALAQRRRHDVSALALLATPWDFHAEGADRARLLSRLLAPMLPAVSWWGEMPVDGLQALFAGLDPLLALTKFSRLADLDPASPAARDFVALEDWLNDGVPLAAPVAIESIGGWYGENSPAAGLWRVAGEPVRPEALTLPSLHLIPARDRIVPPGSARALAARMAGAEVMTPPLGHIGMIVGSRAPAQVWLPLANWLIGAGRA